MWVVGVKRQRRDGEDDVKIVKNFQRNIKNITWKYFIENIWICQPMRVQEFRSSTNERLWQKGGLTDIQSDQGWWVQELLYATKNIFWWKLSIINWVDRLFFNNSYLVNFWLLIKLELKCSVWRISTFLKSIKD